jgi:hypothetical protein
MFRNSDRTLTRHDPGRSNESQPARRRWGRQSGGRAPGVAYQLAICPRCRLMIRDQVAISAGYCARCQDFTLMCGAGRGLVSPDVTARTSWHWPCTSTGTTRWQISRASGPAVFLLCPEHDAELAAGRVSWIEQAHYIGPAWAAAR